MPKTDDLFLQRKSLDEICGIPDKIISVYSLEQHVWAGSNSLEARKTREPELQTIEEFQIDPVRPFLNDIFRNMAAPYKPDRKDSPVGQGYWIQAEFGSGKSHLLCFLAGLALGSKGVWDLVQEKENKKGRGKRESLYRFWEEGLEAKNSNGKKGIFVVVKTLVGTGGGTIGLSEKGRRLSEYIIDAVREQIQNELGKNLSLYPVELLADRFISKDLERYRTDLKKFLRDPAYFEEDEFENVDDFIRDIQQNKSPEYKRSCGNKLWRFYKEYLRVHPDIAAETEDILRHMVETILNEGFAGVLLVLDEVSLFMKNRDEDQRTDDEKTLVVLSNVLGKVHNLPVWTVCSAQQAIESKMGVKNIIADDRLKLVKLLEEDKDYYDIVLARVREVKDPKAIANYYIHYKRGFTWPNTIGESEFTHFFPFHKPALEVLRAVTYELTTTRSAIHFMHQTLKYQVKSKGRELIRLWELFDEAVRYEEDPSGVHAGLVAIKTKKETEYKAYEACRRQIDSISKGLLKVHREKAIKVIQTLFLYYIAKTRQQGITAEDIANAVLIERDAEANPDENIQHYENLAENLKKELRQIVQAFDEDNRPRYRFDPVYTGIDPHDEFKKARDEAESNELMQREAWQHLLGLNEWQIKTRQITIDLAGGVRSIFKDIADSLPAPTHKTLEIIWEGRVVEGLITMRDLQRVASGEQTLPAIITDQDDRDFAVFVASKAVQKETVDKILTQCKDPRVILWAPAELSKEEKDRLMDFAAYRKLISDWQGKDAEDAVAVINWVNEALSTDMGKIAKIVEGAYGRGRMDAINNSQMQFHMAGELTGILAPIVNRVLSSAYVSRDIKFDHPFQFRKEEGAKVINGIVKTGSIPKGAKPNQNISAAQNFGFGLKIMKKSAERQLDTTDNPYMKDIWDFINDKLADEGQSMKFETLYKNFMGIGGPKDYGLTRRMVQIYILCLVQQGKIRIDVGPKSGTQDTTIDYSSIAGIDFSAKVLDSLVSVQKVAKPENWDVLHPYAEKLLNESMPVTHDDAIIAQYRARLDSLFKNKKEEAARVADKAKSLFETLKVANPYETEISQVAKLYSTELSGGNDINLILFALKDTFDYQAFDTNTSSQAEVDDLANRLKNYSDVHTFVSYELELRTAQAYCVHSLPEIKELHLVQEAQQQLAAKISNVQPYIDSEVKLKTELIGSFPPVKGQISTLSSLISAYTTVYSAIHDTVIEEHDKTRRSIHGILHGNELKALKILEGVSAFHPPVSSKVEEDLNTLAANLFQCKDSSRTSIEESLKTGPIHECGLTISAAQTVLDQSKRLGLKARAIFDTAFDSKLDVFFNETIRQRLEQGNTEQVISAILLCDTVPKLKTHLVTEALRNQSLVEIINRYLKKIVVKKVSLKDFRPQKAVIEQNQIADLALEFQKYLEDEFESIPKDDESLPMLHIE